MEDHPLTATRLAIAAGLAMSLVTPRVDAGYGATAAARMARHAVHDLEFTSAPVLHRASIGARDEAIRRAHGVLRQVLDSDRVEDLYDADEVIAERRRLLARVGKATPARFREETRLEDLVVVESEDSTAIKRPDVFRLSVSGDGSAIQLEINQRDSLWNEEYRLTEDEAEREGRRLVTKLALVPASDLEQLEFFRTRYIRFTGNENIPAGRCVATEIIFLRNIGGVPFIGPIGSGVKIEVGAGSKVRSIRVDWAPVEAGAEQQIVADSELFNLRFRGQIRMMTPQVDLAAVSLRSKVCGYLDYGAAADQELLQLGCQVDYIESHNDSAVPTVAYIPLAVEPADDGVLGPDRARRLEQLGRDVALPAQSISVANAQSMNDKDAPLPTGVPVEPDGGCSFGVSTKTPLWRLLGCLLLLGLQLRRRRPRPNANRVKDASETE